jgi:hypothetical protein
MNTEQDHIHWCKQNYALLKNGGSWAVPRSGLIFQRTENGYELINVMPYTDDMAIGAYLGKDVPQSAEELLAYQRSDFAVIKKYNTLAGLEVTDPKGLLG